AWTTTTRCKPSEKLRAGRGAVGAAVTSIPTSRRQISANDGFATGARMIELTARQQRNFWAKVDAQDGAACWRWTAARYSNGYGHMGIGPLSNPRSLLAHRVAYELCIGPIPDGLTVDHLCFNPGCVNPAHLEAVTQGINTLRGNSMSSRRARRTHCPQCHPYDQVYRDPVGREHRLCTSCRRNAAQRARDKARRALGCNTDD